MLTHNQLRDTTMSTHLGKVTVDSKGIVKGLDDSGEKALGKLVGFTYTTEKKEKAKKEDSKEKAKELKEKENKKTKKAKDDRRKNNKEVNDETEDPKLNPKKQVDRK